MHPIRVQRALISVSDKAGLAEFARGLLQAGVELFASGGTRSFLIEQGAAVRDIADYTGFPEMLDGRVKTLHPKVHGGILCRQDRADDLAALAAAGIATFELVVVNLYPFERTAARGDASPDEIVEQIDVGGPALIRAAAKNHAFVTIVTGPSQYGPILDAIQQTGGVSAERRRELATEAFAHTSAYDAAIHDWLGETPSGGADAGVSFPDRLALHFRLSATLRYGENPHQRAALYAEHEPVEGSLIAARQLNGKELSYNNLLDLDSGLAMVRGLDGPAAVVIKHNNPCGAAIGETAEAAVRQALAGDPLSAFGGVLAFNRPVDEAAADALCAPGLFIEAIVAPRFSPAALELLRTRPKWKANVRLLEAGDLQPARPSLDFRRIAGGMLVQEADVAPDQSQAWSVATRRQPDDGQWRDLKFAWVMVRHVKSNAIVVVRDQTLRGVGAGQMSRVDSVRISLAKAADFAHGAALASDAFFPFADSVQAAADAGVTALIQPGGSRNDREVIEACDAHGLAMVFTGVRHFKH